MEADASEEDAKWMASALEEAEIALKEGEVPVGCIYVEDSREVARAHNVTNATMNPTAHAELVAMAAHPDVDWTRCDLYVTCEPCIMCASALAQVGIRRVVFGCRNDKFGGCGSILSLHQGRFDLFEGPGKDDAITIFQRFYARDNVRTVGCTKKRTCGEFEISVASSSSDDHHGSPLELDRRQRARSE